MATNFNVEPYYDNYDEEKKFHRILFRPGYAVQARELTQLQTILQKQIERQGNHFFKEGAMVIPGQISYDTKLKHVKLTSKVNGVDTNSFVKTLVGKTIVGQVTGVRAIIVQVTAATASDSNMIYIKYIKSGSDDSATTPVEEGEQSSFLLSEVLTTEEDNPLDEVSVQIAASAAFGESAAASIGRGVFYTKGFFVLVEEQTVILSKFSKSPTLKVGLHIVESLVTPEDDETILDNAQNSYNYAAPGAHRYAIDAILETRSISSAVEEHFIELLRLSSGKIQYMVNRTEYAVLEETLARRTYDESGNYTIRPFKIDVRQYRDNNRGAWAPGRAYLIGDIVTSSHTGKTLYYVSKSNGISSSGPSSTNLSLDTGITSWEQTSNPPFNRGINKPLTSIKVPLLDGNGEPSFNEDGTQIFSPNRSATVADNQQWAAKLSVGMEAGKAYVFGYEIEKLGTTYIDVEKSRSTATEEDVLFPVDYGNYVLVTNMNFVPDVSTFPLAIIYDRYTSSLGAPPVDSTAVGTARIRGIEWHSGAATGAGAYYKLFLFDVAMNSKSVTQKYSFTLSAKQFYIQGGTSAISFTADTALFPELKTGTINVSGTSIVGQNTRFLSDFAVGDYIFINDASRRITSIADNITMTISSSGGTQTGIEVLKSTSLLSETTNNSLIFELPQYAIKTVSQAEYYVAELFKSVTSNASSQIVLTTAHEFANPNDFGNYTVFSRSTGATSSFTAVRSDVNKTITITVPGATDGASFNVLATIQKGLSVGRKTKTYTSSIKTFTTQASTSVKTIWLTHADGIKLKSVMMKAGSFANPSATYSQNITSRFNFNGGQTASYYGPSSITLKDGQAFPSAPIEVTFEYYAHSSGDFFTADSYPDYSDTPRFGSYALRDCIDFRPKADDSPAGVIIFTGNNDLVPKFGKDIVLSYEYYLGRKSKIMINKAGEFSVVSGAPAIAPNMPEDTTDGMTLYELQLEPYTFGTTAKSVIVTPVENQRYTMKDIGKISKRVDQLEYYTSLSLLEQETKNMTIRDNEGLDRFKNGFIVDSFTGHSIGDTSSPDYMCSVDMQNGVLRPFYAMESVDFVETLSDNSARGAANINYRLTGDLITLPYSNVELVSQTLASTAVNVNPFAVFTFLGKTDITPPFDKWFEVTRRPDIIVNVEGNYNTIRALAEKSGVLGTVWNAWQTQWTGASTTTNNTRTAVIQQGQRNVFADIGIADWDRDVGVRTVTTSLTATEVGQSRSGVNTSIVEKIEYKTLNDKVLSVAAIPFMRSRKLLVQTNGLKPSTRFYPYFDKIDMSSYCYPADKLIITGGNNIAFDTNENSGNDYKNAARSLGPNPDFALNVGDVITGGTSRTTAIVVGSETLPTGQKAIYVVNVKDASDADGVGFSAGETITGSISLATAVVSSHTKYKKGNNLLTSALGSLYFMMDVPNTDALRFRTGKRELALLDIATYNLETAFSSSIAEFSAEGFLETKQATIQATRNAEIVQNQISQNRTVIQSSDRVTQDTGWYDPLAQTFLVDGFPASVPTGDVSSSTNSGGCFLTKVDIYFATKDDSLPVTLQIREVVNGYPGRVILPFSEVIKPASAVTTSLNGTTATTFTFKSPVYVKNATEYCIVLLTNSIKYTVWISELGEKDLVSKAIIDKQPYAGVLFKSQNASTWTAEQMQDMKFKIHRAKFTTGKFGRVEFENAILPDVELDEDPIQFTASSNKVRVNMRNHGLTVGSKITLRIDKDPAAGTIAATKSSNAIVGTDTNFTDTLYPGLISGTVTSSATTTTITGLSSIVGLMVGKTITRSSGAGTLGTAATIISIDSSSQITVEASTACGAGAIVFNAGGSNIYRSNGRLIGEVGFITSDTALTLVSNSSFTYDGEWQVADPIYGVSPASIFKQHTVSSVEEFDNFIITLNDTAAQSGYGGGVGVRSQRNVQYDAIQPFVTFQKFTNTQIIPYFVGITGKSIDGTQTPYLLPSEVNSGFKPITLNETNYLPYTHMVVSQENAETRPVFPFTGTFGGAIDLSSKSAQINSAIIRTDIYSDIDTLSPVIDTRSVSAILITNKINNPTTAINISPIDTRQVLSSAYGITFNGTGIISVVDVDGNSNREKIQSLYSGQYVTISGSSVSSNSSTPVMITDVALDGSSFTVNATLTAPTSKTITTVARTSGVVTITTSTAHGYAVGDKVTVTATTNSTLNGEYTITGVASTTFTYAKTGVDIVSGADTGTTLITGDTISLVAYDRYFDEITPFGSSSYSKYVTRKIDLANPSTFLKIRLAASVPTTSDVKVYYKLGLVGSYEDFSTIEYTKATATFIKSNDGTFRDTEIDIPDLEEFNSVSIKIVFTSTNSVRVPEIKDLRIIACA